MTSFCSRLPLWLILAAAFSSAEALADRAADIARIHLEAIGGRERISALTAVRMTGKVFAAGKDVRFTMIAARPAMVRLETESGGRTLIQATDGKEPAWEFDTGSSPPKYRDMPEASAKTFVADSEFDDPLVTAEARGFTFDYAGEVQNEGHKLIRLLVTRRLSETFSVLIDDDTYFIVKRVEFRTTTGGRKLQVVTHYDDFRPVQGVLLPHDIIVAVDGKVTQQTKVARIEPNPPLTPELFSRPRVVLPPVQKP